MASQKKAYRHHLLCPVCLKTQQALLMHLRRVCMKNSTEEAIEAEVEKAKDDAHQVLASGRLFSYVVLQQIIGDHDPLTRMIEELQRHHVTVIGVPPPLPNANVVAGASTNTITQPPESADSETGEKEQSGEASVSSGEMFQCYPNVKYTNPTRQKMEKKGLYKKHSLDYPLLKDFGKYLEKELQNENFKQEVENVARYLYYVDPQAPSLGFVKNREKLRQYLCELSEANLKRQTQQNYLKALKRFLVYHTVNTNLRHKDEALHGDCRAFIDYIGFLQDICSKQVSKEITQKRHNMLIEKHQLTTTDCWAVLSAAKKDFLAVITKVFDNRHVLLESSECLLVVYYLEAVMILKHLQRPGVVEHMTVQEWISRKRSGSNVIIGVKEHKTAAQQVATFALTEDEESWFDKYYTLVRPQLLTCKKRKRVEDPDFLE